MPLTSGTRLGSYTIEAPLGAGGMGEVYRARDTRLRREVAIKIVRDASATSTDLARFEREARVLASLSHPNIASIHGFEVADGLNFIVMELVAGATLADRLARGPLRIDEAVACARQIAEALEYAHGRGIVHRDLKPANVAFTADRSVKLLDFGIATALLHPDDSRAPLPTGSDLVTSTGTLIGTPMYMSPEQLRGEGVDARTDVWAFGCVLYEMLTARPAHSGATVPDVIVHALEREPEWSALPRAVPASVERVIRRALQRDPRRRWQHMGDVRIELEDREGDTRLASASPPSRRMGVGAAAAAGIAIGALLAGVPLLLTRSPTAADLSGLSPRFTLALPPGDSLTTAPNAAISPDGTRIAYVAIRSGRRQIFVRAVDSVDPVPLAGGQDAVEPFFSPDGKWIAFFAAGKLKKVPAAGGPAVVLADVPSSRGGSWGADDIIVYAPTATSGLMKVSAQSGRAEPFTTPDPSRHEGSHRWPEFLPDGRSLVFAVGPTITASSWSEGRVMFRGVDGRTRELVAQASRPRYLRTGHLAFMQMGALKAVPFDAERGQVTGALATLIENVAQLGNGGAQIAVSTNGTLVYQGGRDRQPQPLVWIDRSGRIDPTPLPPHEYQAPRLARDGRTIAVTVSGADTRVWIGDVTRGTLAPAVDQTANMWSVWTPDGTRLVFTSNRLGPSAIYTTTADGSGTVEPLTPVRGIQVPQDVSRDGKLLLLTRIDGELPARLWLQPLDGNKDTERRFGEERPFNEYTASISPDGRYVAYASDESGRSEVYVRPFPGAGRRRLVSTAGGFEPAWARDGRELYFRVDTSMMGAAIGPGDQLDVGTPRALFDVADVFPGSIAVRNYDVAPDGRFLFVKGVPAADRELQIVVNWFVDVKRRMAAAK